MKEKSQATSFSGARSHLLAPMAVAILICGLCPLAASAAYVLNDVEVCSPVMGFCDSRGAEGQRLEIERKEQQRNGSGRQSVAGKASVQVDYGQVQGALGVSAKGEGRQFSVGLTGMFSGRFNDRITVASDSLPVGTPVEIVLIHQVEATIQETGVTTLSSGEGVGGDLRLASSISLAVFRGSKQVNFQTKTWCTDGSSYQPPISCTDSFSERRGLRTRWTVQAQVGDQLDLSVELYGTAFAAQATGEDTSKPVVLKGFAATAGPDRAALSRVLLQPSQAAVSLEGESGKRW